MTIAKKRGLWIITVSLFFVAILARKEIAHGIGKFLMMDSRVEKSDVVAFMSGGTNYERLLTAFDLYKDGYAKAIFITKSLSDLSNVNLQKFGITLPTTQERSRAILVELGVPNVDIFLDKMDPGGGTKGEMTRINHFMLNDIRKSKLIIVTSWWHTRRTRLIASQVLDKKINFIVVPAVKYGKSLPTNWWHYRYEALHVIEEIPKLFFYYINSFLSLSFADDPGERVNQSGI